MDTEENKETEHVFHSYKYRYKATFDEIIKALTTYVKNIQNISSQFDSSMAKHLMYKYNEVYEKNSSLFLHGLDDCNRIHMLKCSRGVSQCALEVMLCMSTHYSPYYLEKIHKLTDKNEKWEEFRFGSYIDWVKWILSKEKAYQVKILTHVSTLSN